MQVEFPSEKKEKKTRIKTYRKGADYERRIVKEARQKGYIALRSAGSHSPIDVVIVDFLNYKIRLIQCKAGNYTEKFKRDLEDTYKFLNKKFDVEFQVV